MVEGPLQSFTGQIPGDSNMCRQLQTLLSQGGTVLINKSNVIPTGLPVFTVNSNNQPRFVQAATSTTQSINNGLIPYMTKLNTNEFMIIPNAVQAIKQDTLDRYLSMNGIGSNGKVGVNTELRPNSTGSLNFVHTQVLAIVNYGRSVTLVGRDGTVLGTHSFDTML